MQRQMIVELNGEVIATLMYGETVTRALEPGRHRLRIDNTWVWKNVDFSAAPGDHIKFRAINRAGRLTWWMVAALGAGPMYITLEREP
jgi:hypothetical protein